MMIDDRDYNKKKGKEEVENKSNNRQQQQERVILKKTHLQQTKLKIDLEKNEMF